MSVNSSVLLDIFSWHELSTFDKLNQVTCQLYSVILSQKHCDLDLFSRIKTNKNFASDLATNHTDVDFASLKNLKLRLPLEYFCPAVRAGGAPGQTLSEAVSVEHVTTRGDPGHVHLLQAHWTRAPSLPQLLL